jgi:hypothetical protein
MLHQVSICFPWVASLGCSPGDCFPWVVSRGRLFNRSPYRHRWSQPFCTRKYNTNRNTAANNATIIFMVRSVRFLCMAKSLFSRLSSKRISFQKLYFSPQRCRATRCEIRRQRIPAPPRFSSFQRRASYRRFSHIMNCRTIFPRPVPSVPF